MVSMPPGQTFTANLSKDFSIVLIFAVASAVRAVAIIIVSSGARAKSDIFRFSLRIRCSYFFAIVYRLALSFHSLVSRYLNKCILVTLWSFQSGIIL